MLSIDVEKLLNKFGFYRDSSATGKNEYIIFSNGQREVAGQHIIVNESSTVEDVLQSLYDFETMRRKIEKIKEKYLE